MSHEQMFGNPHRAEITSPRCLRGAQLSTPTYLDCHTEKRRAERGGCEIMGKGERKKGEEDETERERRENCKKRVACVYEITQSQKKDGCLKQRKKVAKTK